MTGSTTGNSRLTDGEQGRHNKPPSPLPGSRALRAESFALRARGIQWSLAIHGVVLLAVVLMQLRISAIPQNRITVIDFTLSGPKASALPEQSSSDQAPGVANPEQKHAAAPQPKAIAEKQSVPQPHTGKAAPPSPVPDGGGEITDDLPQVAGGPDAPPAEGKAGRTSFSQAADGSGALSANGTARNPADGAGRAQGTGGGSGNAGADVTQEKSRTAYLKEHFVYIRDRITGNISYPPMARKMGWCGQVKIAFVVCVDGGVNDVRVIESSGFGLLDRNAVDTVKTVAPFPPPPVSAEIRMAITYRFN